MAECFAQDFTGLSFRLQGDSCQSRGKAKTTFIHLCFFNLQYAFKQGRITIPPTTFLEHCELLSSPARAESKSERDMWDSIEVQRKKGLKVAENMTGLDDGAAFFDSEETMIFAEY